MGQVGFGVFSPQAALSFKALRERAALLATSIIVDLALAPVTAVVAYQHKRPVIVWASAGLIFGAWALAAILILVRLRRAQAPAPPRPDAA